MSARLINAYNTDLMSDANVRLLVKSVAQDPQNETVDVKKTGIYVKRAANEIGDGGKARRRIIGWLNDLFFTSKEQEIPSCWWWEMHTRIQKLLLVAMVLEGENLRSFGAVPETTDIPQCLIGLQLELERQREAHFSLLKTAFQKDVQTLQKDAGFGAEYIDLYISPNAAEKK